MGSSEKEALFRGLNLYIPIFFIFGRSFTVMLPLVNSFGCSDRNRRNHWLIEL